MNEPCILAVEDDAANRRIIAQVLGRDSIQVSFAETGEEALRMLDVRPVPYQVVLLDRMMTGIDGLEVLLEIKKIPELADMPVILQTGAVAPDQVNEGLRAGARYYLTKPYSPDTLRTIVRSALRDVDIRRELSGLARTYASAVSLLEEGRFTFHTLDEAQRLAALLAQLGSEPGAAVIGLAELLVNAVEHGNLAFTCSDKAALLRSGRWVQELAHRAQLDEYRQRCVKVSVARVGSDLHVTVEDEGQGFDHTRYMDFDSERAFEPNGRGIAMARQVSFSSLEYLGVGNRVVATLAAALPSRAESSQPVA